MDAAGRVHALSLSAGGVPKRPVSSVRVAETGLEGDWQKDRRHHGGPDRAVCLWSLEVIEALRAEGHPVVPGAAGENVTVAGVPWAALGPGDRLALGDEVVLEATAWAGPCAKIRAVFADGAVERIDPDEHPGSARLYARVLRAGTLSVGDRVVVTPPGA